MFLVHTSPYVVFPYGKINKNLDYTTPTERVQEKEHNELLHF